MGQCDRLALNCTKRYSRKSDFGSRFCHQLAHAPTSARPLTVSIGTRHGASASKPLKTTVPAPNEPNKSGTTQQEDATTAPRPAAIPNVARKPGVASGGYACDSLVIGKCVESSKVMSPTFQIARSLHPVATTGSRKCRSRMREQSPLVNLVRQRR